MKTMANRQRGLSFFGFLVLAVGVIFLAVFGMKIVPPYVHSAQIKQIMNSVANDPEMQNAQNNVIKASFDKRAGINYIADVSGDDLVIEKSGGKLSLSASYIVRIPLVANITLLLEFNPSSS